MVVAGLRLLWIGRKDLMNCRDFVEQMLLNATHKPVLEGSQIEGVGGNIKGFGRSNSPTDDVIKNLVPNMTDYK